MSENETLDRGGNGSDASSGGSVDTDSTVSIAKEAKFFDPGTFSGRDGDHAAAFLKRFNRFADHLGWDESKKLMAFPARLRGSASAWFSRLPDATTDNWALLINEFTKEYPSRRPGATPVQQLLACKQETQSVRGYADRFRGICRNLDQQLDHPLIKDFFMCGLRPELQAFVRTHAEKPFVEIVQYAAEIEPHLPPAAAPHSRRAAVTTPAPATFAAAAQARPTPTHSAPTTTTTDSSRDPRAPDGRPICKYCKKPGHVLKYCRTRMAALAATEQPPAPTPAPPSRPTQSSMARPPEQRGQSN